MQSQPQYSAAAGRGAYAYPGQGPGAAPGHAQSQGPGPHAQPASGTPGAHPTGYPAMQAQWYQGPDGTYYVMGQDGRLYPVVMAGASSPETQKRRPAGFWAIVVVAVACIVAALLIGLNMCNKPANRSGELGSVAGMNEEQILDELDRVVSNGMFNISIASTVTFPDGESEGDLKIENPQSNSFLMSVDITRDDTGESIYHTDMIEPGYMVYSDKLGTDLSAGIYPCTATFTAYDDDEREVGRASAGITIQVGK